jgi:hypothetical protein
LPKPAGAASRLSLRPARSPCRGYFVHLLSQTFKLGKRLKGEYVMVILDTRRAHLTVYRQGRIFKRWPYPFLKK